MLPVHLPTLIPPINETGPERFWLPTTLRIRQKECLIYLGTRRINSGMLCNVFLFLTLTKGDVYDEGSRGHSGIPLCVWIVRGTLCHRGTRETKQDGGMQRPSER